MRSIAEMRRSLGSVIAVAGLLVACSSGGGGGSSTTDPSTAQAGTVATTRPSAQPSVDGTLAGDRAAAALPGCR